MARKVAREALLEAKLEKIRKLQAEVKELRTKTATDQAVVLQVKIMELQVSKMRELGLDFQTAEGIGFQQLTGGPLIKLEVINELIEALRKHELVKVLAEPSLVTVSGRPATFQSGGEFPITVPQSLGTQTVEYRQFGTRLDCLVDELDNGRIRLELRATVSEIDTSRSVMIQHTSVPGLRTRQIDTAVELDAGQTIVLSGMTQQRVNPTGDSAELEETALLVTVTADLGEPVMQAGKKAHPNVAKNRGKNNFGKCCNGWIMRSYFPRFLIRQRQFHPNDHLKAFLARALPPPGLSRWKSV